jgi:hypothetical protein
MKDEQLRRWLADRRRVAVEDGYVDTGIVTPSVIMCPQCGEALAVRFRFEGVLGDVVVADVEWTEEAPHRWTRPAWDRTDAGRPARHAGYQKRSVRPEPTPLPSGGTLVDGWVSAGHPGIRELRAEDELVCRCGAVIPLATLA